jgi:hypothetical protein
MKNTWTKIKNKIKDNPEDTIFYGTTIAATAIFVGAYIYIVKETNKEIDAYNKAVAEQEEWTVNELSHGRLVTYLPNGTPWSFDPTKPLIETD